MEEKTKRPKIPGSGRKKKEGKKVTLRIAYDVINILKEQINQTEYIESAVREKHAQQLDSKQ